MKIPKILLCLDAVNDKWSVVKEFKYGDLKAEEKLLVRTKWSGAKKSCPPCCEYGLATLRLATTVHLGQGPSKFSIRAGVKNVPLQ